MKIDERFHYDADPDTVVTMMTDPAFQDRKAVASGAIKHDVQVSRRDSGPITTVTRTLPISGVPDAFSKFLKDTVEITETIKWDGDPGMQRTGEITIRFNGSPMVLRGQLTLKAVGNGTDGRLTGDLKCSVPLIGGKAEKALAPQIVKGLQREVEAGQAYLAERS